jgi:two-component system OmpR family response regulator
MGSIAIPPSASSPRLLIVDDDAEIVAMVSRYFGGHGFDVATAADGAAMRAVIESGSIDVILLDLGLPREDGLELTRYLRGRWKGAIIIVTGRGESVDRVVGLELGADDYVTKPFDLRELLARVRSVLRRMQPAVVADVAASVAPDIEFAGFRLATHARRLSGPDGKEIPLTTGEFDLLQVFLDSPGLVLTRDQLIGRMHGREAGPYDRAIDVQVGRLRRKIEQDPANPELIKSVRGAGYLFAARLNRS